MKKVKVFGEYPKSVDAYLAKPFRVKAVFELKATSYRKLFFHRITVEPKPIGKQREYIEYGPNDLHYLSDSRLGKDRVEAFSPEFMFEPINFILRLSIVNWVRIHILEDTPYEKLAEYSWTDEADDLRLETEAQLWSNPNVKFWVYKLRIKYRDEPVILVSKGVDLLTTKAICTYDGKLMLYSNNSQIDENTARNNLYKFLCYFSTELVSEHYRTRPVGYIKSCTELRDIANRFGPIVFVE